MADAMAVLKRGGESEARKRYKLQVVAERLTGMMTPQYVNEAMQWGIEQEANARARYEEITGNLVSPCGFAIHCDIQFFGASPDGLVGDDGLVEIKCPTTETLLEWMLEGMVPEKYKPQMLAQLAVTGRKWVDFFAFDPRIRNESYQYFLRRYEPAETEIVAVEEAARAFLNEVDSIIAQITGYKGDES